MTMQRRTFLQRLLGVGAAVVVAPAVAEAEPCAHAYDEMATHAGAKCTKCGDLISYAEVIRRKADALYEKPARVELVRVYAVPAKSADYATWGLIAHEHVLTPHGIATVTPSGVWPGTGYYIDADTADAVLWVVAQRKLTIMGIKP